jgi:hypothetical protein
MKTGMDDAHNPEFVGKSEKFKFLAIHGYEKYQADYKTGKLVDGSRLYIKDATRKDSDADYSGLTMVQRYILDGLRRQTGLHGQWPRNDVMWVSRALCVLPKERAHVPHALRTLTSRGLLTLSNQQLNSQEVLEVEVLEAVEADKTLAPPEHLEPAPKAKPAEAYIASEKDFEDA